MSALTNAVAEIKFRIPRQILDTVFIKRDQQWRQTPVSIDEHVLNEVIRPRVLVDCNLVGGAELYVPLDGIPYENFDMFTTVYRIPKSKTQNRSIMSVLSVSFSDPSRSTSYGNAAFANNSAMLRAGNQVMDAMGSVPITSTASVQLIGENVVMVKDNSIIPSNSFLRCIVAHDENMSHLQLKSYRHFSELCVLATKAYIYNEYIIDLDMGQLVGGVNIGRFKDIVDGYADADELYRTYLTEKFEKVSFMNDAPSYTKFLRSMFGNH
jgi:hypothetical protein